MPGIAPKLDLNDPRVRRRVLEALRKHKTQKAAAEALDVSVVTLRKHCDRAGINIGWQPPELPEA